MRKATEWTKTGTFVTGNDPFNSIHTKLSRHRNSQSHLTAVKVMDASKRDLLKQSLVQSQNKHMTTTFHVFRSAYLLAKNMKPYVDHPSMVAMQKANGLDVGVTLHSRYSASLIL